MTTLKRPTPEDRKQAEVQINVRNIPGPDFTTYEERSFEAKLPKGQQGSNGSAKRYSHSLSCLIVGPRNKQAHGRGLACVAYGGRFWSITLRCDIKNRRKRRTDYLKQVKKLLKEFAKEKKLENKPKLVMEKGLEKEKSPRKGKLRDYLGFCPAGYKIYESAAKAKINTGNDEIFLNDIYQICRQLREVLSPEGTPLPGGLIAITGATDSSKSLITRGLIFLLLEAAATRAFQKGLRKPHLITFEDPIEEYYIKGPDAQPTLDVRDIRNLLEAVYVDYTPRDRDLDNTNLRKVIKDALRQTPALLFVGETRKGEDWNDLLEFAGSGHLVITTSHASSVVEAMTRIFRDTKTRTAAQRSEIARRILGIINIRSLSPQVTAGTSTPTKRRANYTKTANVRALLPALWKSTPQSKNNLIADGLASLLPALDREHEIGYYSRTYFARELAKVMTPQFKWRPDRLGLLDEIRRQAKEWDIEGV